MTLDELKAFFLEEGALYLKHFPNDGDNTRDRGCSNEVLALIAEADRAAQDLHIAVVRYGVASDELRALAEGLMVRIAELERANSVLQSHARERSGERGKFIEAANAAYNAKRKLAEQDDAAREENARLTERVAELEAEVTRLRDITEDDDNVECPACSVPLVVSPHRELRVSEEDSNDEHVAFIRGHRSAYEAVFGRLSEATAALSEFCIEWIEHSTNYNDRVTSRDALNALTLRIMGESMFQTAQEAVRLNCRARDTERSSRCDFTADQMGEAHAFCNEAVGNEAVITDENGDARLLLVTRVSPLDEEQKP